VLVTAAVRDQTVVAGAVLRVWAGEDVVGGAFLVAPDLVATSAGVVAEALGADPASAEPPVGEVRLDFPLLHGDGLPVQVKAFVERWSAGDTALLRLAGPALSEARMPPLRRVEELAGCSFSVLGYPEGAADGIWTTGEIQPATGPGRHRLCSAPGEQPVVTGFSGAPVWEARTGAVVGMAIPGNSDAELLPIDAVIGRDPEAMPSPYQGLRAFDESHADLFFGRDLEIQRLLDAVDRVPVVVVAGPSGAGKSSLVRAGLVPRLRAAGAKVVYVRAEPGARPPASPVGARERGTVLVVDQFEELAALDPAAARELFEEIVRRTGAEEPESANGSVRAVLTMRWTTLDELLTPELTSTLETGTVLVGPLDRAHLREVIVRPAGQPPGLAFEPGLVEAILDDAGAEPGRLPLVESLLAELWERRDGGFLTVGDYEAAGGVAGALAQHAEAVVDGLPAGPEDPLRGLLTALARPDPDGRFVRRAMPVAELPPAQRALVPALAAGRLLTTNRSARDSDVVELAHQALIDHWARLQEWLAEDREFLSWREQVGAQRERWEADGRDDSALLRGAVLAGGSDWLPARADELPDADLEYVRRSTARQRREVRRWRIVTAVVAALTVVAGALAVVSVRSGDQIAARLAIANADALGRDAQTRLAEDPVTAAQLALAAWRADPQNPQARAALAQSYVAMRSVERELPGLTGGPIQNLLVGGDTAVLHAAPHPVVVTGLAGPAPTHYELTDVAYETQLAVSPDGRWLASQSPDRTGLQLRDLIRGGPPVNVPGRAGVLAAATRFSSDGERLAWLALDPAGPELLRIWDLRTNAELAHGVGPLDETAWSATLTPGLDQVLIRYGDPEIPESRVVVHSLADGAELATLPAGAGIVLNGAAGATCEPSTDPAGSPDSVLVTPVDGSPARRIALVTSSCSTRPGLSVGGTALIESHTGRTFRVTDLRTGEAFHVTVPAEPPAMPLHTFDGHPTLEFLHTSSGPQVVFARGSALLVLRAEPIPADEPSVGLIIGTVDGVRLVKTGEGLHTTDTATGHRLAEVPGVTDAYSVTGLDEGGVWNARLAPGGWHLTRYELPALRRAEELLLTSRDGSSPPVDNGSRPAITFVRESAADGGRLFAIGDGVLTGWDVGAARQVGPPIPLGTTEQQIGLDRTYPHMHLRPGHPGQVAVVRIGEVQVWDVPLGRLVATIPAAALLDTLYVGASPIAFDASGDRLAVLGTDHTLQLWDIDTAAQVRPPIPAPTISNLLGFDADGYLVVVREGPSTIPLNLAFVDTDSDAGFEAGSIEMTHAIGSYPHYLSDDRRTVPLQLSGGRVLDLPITAQAWRDGLCSVADRPLTPDEERLLPPGTATESACRGRR
jgi:WD40 repeat protein